MDSDSDDSPESLVELCQRKQEAEWQRFHAKLDVPHNFQLENEHRLMGPRHMRKLRRGIETALDAGYETALERARGKNYLAFLMSLQGENQKALDLTGEALKEMGEGHNLVSLANRAVILWKMGHVTEAEEGAKLIEMMNSEPSVDIEYLKVKAKAELAFVCTRMGPSSYVRAMTIFEEVLGDVLGPMPSSTQHNEGRHARTKAREPEKWLWKFGLGLVRRRSLHFMHAPLFHGRNTTVESQAALGDFLEVIRHSKSKSLKAKSYAEIATLIGLMSWDEHEKRELAYKAEMWPLKACKRAYELDDNDNSVLCKVGKFLRKAKFFEDSKELLEKALKNRPSSTAYHHLGLTYKVLARENSRIENGEQLHYVPRRAGSWRDARGRGNRGRGRGGGRRDNRGRYESDEGSKTYRKYGNLLCNNENDYGGLDYSNRSLQSGEALSVGLSSESARIGARTSFPRDTDRLSQDLHDIQQGLQNLPLEQPDADTQDTQGGIYSSATRQNLRTRPSALADTSPDIFRLRKAIKCPLQSVQTLHRRNRYVAETLECLQEAINFSEGTNLQAVYDLALMYRYLCEFDSALELLEQLRNSNQANLNYLTVNALEQTGLILMEKSGEATTDGEEAARTLAERAYSMCYMALAKQVQLYSRNKRIQGRIGEIWHSFVVLLQKVDKSDLSETEKLMEKVDLFLQTSDTEQSTALLREIEQLSPEERKNPNFLKRCIENHVKRKEYEQALALLEILRNTPGSKTMADLFGDEHYIGKIHLKAAKQPRFQNALNESRYNFRAAFLEIFQIQAEGSSCSSDSDSSEGDPETWDVMVIFDQREESHIKRRQLEKVNHDSEETSLKQCIHQTDQEAALHVQNDQCVHVDDRPRQLASFLRKEYGLRVTVMVDDTLPGRLILDSLVHAMKRSRLVVVLAGQSKLSREFRLLADRAAHRGKRATVCFLTYGTHVPETLKTFRSMTWPPTDVLAASNNPQPQCSGVADAHYTDENAESICRWFRAFIGL